ncbi:hypothetical protein ARMSODRAFT_965086 [Armillaria solidipes]|uniref:Apple domain-containing protein n=1 Tax=Armillaria solidipes TaxID=1076256 RepID=A0A2H3B9N3_9AGAR|nr:hypothetical protein ARMSODRAFT_668215 [Armillaria solidipes]PBK61297.1 hypothetical protein ARMSODRAFT_965086 [Armillaria solidipes]
MRFSVAALLPLALAVPALSASVQARDGSNGGVDYNNNKDGHKDDGKKDYDNKDNGRGNCTWTPVFEHNNDFKGWNKGKYTPYDHKEVDKITFEIECKSFCEKDDKCNSCQAYSHDEKDDKFICELFVEIIDINTWKDDCDYGKDDKDDNKDGEKDDNKDGNKDDNKKDDNKDDKKYYDTSAWNAHYGY